MAIVPPVKPGRVHVHSPAARTTATFVNMLEEAESGLLPQTPTPTPNARMRTHTPTSASGRWTGTGKGRPAQPGARGQHIPQGSWPPPAASAFALGWML